MNFPVVFVNAIPGRVFNSLSHHLNWEGWLRINADYDPNAGISWTMHDLEFPLFYDVASRLKLRSQKVVQTDLSVVKIHVNGQTMGQLSSFHKDSKWDNVWTVVLFTAYNWNTNHGGEFTLFNPEVQQYQSVSYVPNTAVMFPSNWDHKGACPLVPHAGMRTSLAITYCATDQIDDFFDNHNELRRFAR